MDDLLQFVPEEKRDEFKKVAEGYIKRDPDIISELIANDQRLRDRILDKPLKTREQNLRENEFPKLLEARLKEERDKLMKELNPEETPAEKRLRELEQKLADKERKETEYERRSTLRERYKDGAPDVAERLYALDDDSVVAVMQYTKVLRERIDELEKVQKFGGKAPAGGGKGNGKSMSEAEFQAMDSKQQYAFMTGGGTIE